MTNRNLQRDTLRKLAQKNSNPLINLRLEYSELSKLLTGYINPLSNKHRIFPTHLPTQKNFRWSTLNPPITNWPRSCINLTCPHTEHEWREECWSIRDILSCDDDEVLVTWDHDNIEGRIGAVRLDNQKDLEAFRAGYDLHTLTCCQIFGYDVPPNLLDPHSSEICADWRAKYNWQGKDTLQRVLSKNFNHGARYSINITFVRTIKNIERFGISYSELENLARIYLYSRKEEVRVKKAIMAEIKKTRISRNLYGGKRQFYDSSDDTAKEGFNHIISGTVSHYNNETLILIDKHYGDVVRLIHNAHDGDKLAFKKGYVNVKTLKQELQPLIEREISYGKNVLTLTAGIKVHN